MQMQDPDDPDDPDMPTLTAEQVRILAAFADNVSAGHKLLITMAWLVGGATAIAALAYYVIGVIAGWRTLPEPPP